MGRRTPKTLSPKEYSCPEATTRVSAKPQLTTDAERIPKTDCSAVGVSRFAVSGRPNCPDVPRLESITYKIDGQKNNTCGGKKKYPNDISELEDAKNGFRTKVVRAPAAIAETDRDERTKRTCVGVILATTSRVPDGGEIGKESKKKWRMHQVARLHWNPR